MAKTLVERLRDCAQGVSLGADGMGWSPDPALLEEAAEKIVSLHAELQQARDGLTKGRTRMREDNERLRAALLRCARQAEALKRECGMNPESPQAIRNAQYQSISTTAHIALGTIRGPEGA